MKCVAVSLFAILSQLQGAVIASPDILTELKQKKVEICKTGALPLSPCTILNLFGYDCVDLSPRVYFITHAQVPLDNAPSVGENKPLKQP